MANNGFIDEYGLSGDVRAPYAYLSFLRSPIVSQLAIPWDQMYKHCVIIQRDENGYGLRVSGESPVFVESVKPGQYERHSAQSISLLLCS